MSEHVIQNPVPTPEQMASLLGMSQARVAVLREIMRSAVESYRGEKTRKTGTSKTALKLLTPLRQINTRRKTGSGVKAKAL